MTQLTQAVIKSHEQAIAKAKETVNKLYQFDKATGHDSSWEANELLKQIKYHRNEIKTLQAAKQS